MTAATTTETKNTEAVPPNTTAAPLARVAQVAIEQRKQWEPTTPEEHHYALMMRKAVAYSKSGLVPQIYRASPENCFIAIEMADRMNAPPLMIMQAMYLVHGTPGWSGKYLIGSVNTSGRFTPLRFRQEGKPSTDAWGFRAVAKDIKTGEELIGPLVDWRMVKAEGWDKNPKWKSMPEVMFHYRSGAFWSRVFCPEIAMGLLTVEELEDIHTRRAPHAIANGDTKTLEAEVLGETRNETREEEAARAGANPETGELPHTPADEKSEPEPKAE